MLSASNELFAQKVPEIDSMRTGHEHIYAITHVAPYGTLVVNSGTIGTDFQDMTRVVSQVSGNADVCQANVVAARRHQIPQDTEPHAAAVQLISAYVQHWDRDVQITIGSLAFEVDAREQFLRSGETVLGNLMADEMVTAAGAQIALLNSGAIRSNSVWKAGKFMLRDLFDLVSFEEELCRVSVTGLELLQALENSVSKLPSTDGRILQVSGLRFQYSPASPGNQKNLEDRVQVDSTKLKAIKTYVLATTGYLCHGLDGFSMLIGLAHGHD